MWPTIWVLALVALGAGLVWAWRRAGAEARRIRSQQERAQVSAAAFARGSPAVAPAPRGSGGLLAAFRSDEMPVVESAERDDRRLIVSALALAADHLGAAQCVLWKCGAGDDAPIEAVACARGTEPPLLDPTERATLDALLVGELAAADVATRDPRLLMTFVRIGDERAAVTAHFSEIPTVDAAVTRGWLTRHADAIGALADVVQTRAESARRNYKLRAMMQTAKTLQGSRDPQALEQLFADNALLVAGAEWAVVVKWNRIERVGIAAVLTSAAPGFWDRATARQASIVGDVCLKGEGRTFTDARALVSIREAVFDDSPLPVGTGSLVVVPLKRGDDDPAIGALVCGHSVPNALKANDAAAVRELGVVAAGALETAWAMEDATRRAHTDELTGLPNRRQFDEGFTRMIGETDRYGGTSALVLLDIDYFKSVNDSYGHEAGDSVLQAVAKLLTAERRTVDSVARIGGEELALLLPQTDPAGALEVAERLRKRIEALQVHTTAGTIGVTASFGVAMYAARSGTQGRLFERADRALYAAKHAGRNRVEFAAADGAWSA